MINSIPIKSHYSYRKNWYLIYSYMLAPEDEEVQKSIFLYKYYRWNHMRATNGKSTEQDYDQTEAITFLFASLQSNEFDVYDQIRTRLNAVYAAGRLLRLIESIKKLHTDISPSIENAIEAYKRVLTLENIKDKYFSRQYLIDFYQSKQDVWHLCAAFTIINPIKNSAVPFGDRLIHFLSLARHYREFGTKMKKLRRKAELKETLINTETIYNIPSIYPLNEVSAPDINDADFKRIVLGDSGAPQIKEHAMDSIPASSSECLNPNKEDKEPSD